MNLNHARLPIPPHPLVWISNCSQPHWDCVADVLDSSVIREPESSASAKPPHPLVGNGDCFPPFGFNPSKEFEAGPLVRLRVAYRLLKKQETA
jgi:hypothetical protein